MENALKVAFDWKSRQNERAGRPEPADMVLHLRHAFHGRSGYTLSLTNTDPVKTSRFPKFDWPRIASPALRFPLADHVEENRRSEDDALVAGGRELRGESSPDRLLRGRAAPGGRRRPPPFCPVPRRDARAMQNARGTLRARRGSDRCRRDGLSLGLRGSRARARRRRIREEGSARWSHGRSACRRRARQRLQGPGADQLHLGWRAGRHGALDPDPAGLRARQPRRARSKCRPGAPRPSSSSWRPSNLV